MNFCFGSSRVLRKIVCNSVYAERCHQSMKVCLLDRIQLQHHRAGVLWGVQNVCLAHSASYKTTEKPSEVVTHVSTLPHFRQNGKELAKPGESEHPDVFEGKSMEQGGHRLPHPIWTPEEVHSVQETHYKAASIVDKLAYGSVKTLRFFFDLFSGYTIGRLRGNLNESKWTKRIIFLEAVAAVPGMVGAMVIHLKSLRRFQSDQGWIHTLLEEAENERMHLMTAMSVGEAGVLMRLSVFVTQMFFVGLFSLAYIISPRFCHRFVGYFEEEAVKTYTSCLKDIDDGKLKLWSRMKAPEMAVQYWKLPPDAMMRDMILAIRADEGHHRLVNHTLSGMKPEQRNPFKPGF